MKVKKTKKSNKTKSITLRVTPELKEKITSDAVASKITISEYITQQLNTPEHTQENTQDCSPYSINYNHFVNIIRGCNLDPSITEAIIKEVQTYEKNQI